MKNLPNCITVSRMVLIFIFVLLAYFDDTNPNCITVSRETAQIFHIVAYLIAIIAGITDFFDGYLARKYKVESDFGRLLDPLADKVFVLATFTVMLEYQLVPGWILILILAREFLVTGLRTLASAKGVVIAADKLGKIKTFVQMLTLAVAGLGWIHFFGLDLKVGPVHVLWIILLSMVTILTLYSGLTYFVRYRKLYLDSVS